MKIKKIEHNVTSKSVYDIETPCHNYILENGVISHNTMDQYNPKEAGGGSGPRFAASTLIMLNKRKEKDGTEVIGNNIRAVALKSRFTKEYSEVTTMIRYDSGLDRYYGLLDLAEATGVFVKESTRYIVADGSKQFGKAIENNPEKFFTKDVLDAIDAKIPSILCYGKGSSESLSEVIDEATGEITQN